jgi:hypothetical protein
MLLVILTIFLLPFIQISHSNSLIYGVNVGNRVQYDTREYFKSWININNSDLDPNPISHNGTANYYTEVSISAANFTDIDVGIFNNTFGSINGTITETTAELFPQTIQTIDKINVGPFLGYFYPITNITYINETMYNINGTLNSIFIEKNNISELPSDIKHFLNPAKGEILNLSASEKYIFYEIGNDSKSIQPAWYTNALVFNRIIINFRFNLNFSGYFNISYDNSNWHTVQIINKLQMDYLVYVDSASGIVIETRETGNIEYYESKSANVEPYYGEAYNLSLYLERKNTIFSSDVINFGISYWIWIILIIIGVGAAFIVLYVIFTGRNKKEDKLVGNILEE